VGEQLVGTGGPVRVLGEPQHLQRAARVAGSGFGLVALGVEARLRPVQVGADARVVRLPAEDPRRLQHFAGPDEVARVDERVAEQDLESGPLEHVAPLLGRLE
jgi:hypothetical protein